MNFVCSACGVILSQGLFLAGLWALFWEETGSSSSWFAVGEFCVGVEVFIVIQAPTSGWLLENWQWPGACLQGTPLTKIIAISKCSHPLTVRTMCDHPGYPVTGMWLCL